VIDDDTDRSGRHCDVIPVGTAAPRGASLALTVTDPGGGDSISLYSVRSTWTKAAGRIGLPLGSDLDRPNRP
jgi:hypothetical protein